MRSERNFFFVNWDIVLQTWRQLSNKKDKKQPLSASDGKSVLVFCPSFMSFLDSSLWPWKDVSECSTTRGEMRWADLSLSSGNVDMMASAVNSDGSESQQLPVSLLWSSALASQVGPSKGCIKTRVRATANFSSPDLIYRNVWKEELRREINAVHGSDILLMWSECCQRSLRRCTLTANEGTQSHDLRHVCVFLVGQ